MTKKLIVIAMIVGLTMTSMSATQYANGYTWTYQIKGDTAEIYGYYDSGRGRWVAAITPEPVGSVTIPSTLGGRPLASIGELAFLSCRDMTEVAIPDGVMNIGRDAFDACVGLASITIPKSVTNIADSAFVFCSGLKSISVDSENETYKSINGLLLAKDGRQLIKGINGRIGKAPGGGIGDNVLDRKAPFLCLKCRLHPAVAVRHGKIEDRIALSRLGANRADHRCGVGDILAPHLGNAGLRMKIHKANHIRRHPPDD